jgi:prenyltransferase beta subunit
VILAFTKPRFVSLMLMLMLTIGTFGAHPGHDGHILGTLSGIQILVIQNALDRVDLDRIVSCE